MNGLFLAWIASKVKGVTPAVSTADSPAPEIDGQPKIPGGSMAIPNEVQPTTRRRKGGRKKVTVPGFTGSTIAPENDDDGSSKGEDASKSVRKRLIK